MEKWGDKPYHSLDYENKKRFGEKVYKISLAGGTTCPNRDGTLGTRGCCFCSGSGSGDFAATKGSITEQIEEAIARVSRYKNAGHHFTAYFQSFTATYAPVETLRAAWEEAMTHESVVTLAIATRPDCLGDDVLSLLADCCRKMPVTVELGLQTIHPDTIRYIRRGYPNSVYETAVKNLQNIGVNVVTHVIAGLPGETKENFINTVRYVADIGSDGIKLQLLHVLKGTDLALDYESKMFRTLTPDEYLDYIAEALSILPPDMVIHRVTGDGPKDLLIAPLWSADKRMVLNSLQKKMKQEHIFQGKFYHGK